MCSGKSNGLGACTDDWIAKCVAWQSLHTSVVKLNSNFKGLSLSLTEAGAYALDQSATASPVAQRVLPHPEHLHLGQ